LGFLESAQPTFSTDLQVAEYQKSLDLFLHIASLDNSPSAVTESLAAGTPVIVTDVGGAAEHVVSSGGGLVIPSGDPAALARAIARLAMSERERMQMGVLGSAYARKNLSELVIGNQYANIILTEWKGHL